MKESVPLPPGLADLAETRISELSDRGAVSDTLAGFTGDNAATLRRVIGISDFAWRLIGQRPELLEVLDRLDPRREPPVATRLKHYLSLHPGHPGAALRLWRQEMMLCIAWQDLGGQRTLEQNLAALSRCADFALQAANRIAASELAPRFGRPLNGRGKPQELVILAMGKLGGAELNFSSDIDLVFVYPEAGQTDGTRSLDNQQYFARLGQRIIALLDESDELGRVFRVDLRLRPFGEAGPLVVSFNALEAYLQEQGRDWERYAYVKARAVTGAAMADPLFNDVLRPFVYRKYLDFGVFDALRAMRQRIDREMASREMQGNIKQGPGGIREIEFVTQCLQLLRGGQIPALRRRSLLEALAALCEHDIVPPAAGEELISAYRYLRTLENRLQAIDDRQTHDLPEDPVTRERLAAAMHAPGWPGLESRLASHRQQVGRWFLELVPDRPVAGDAANDAVFPGLWTGRLDVESALAYLQRVDCDEPAAFIERLTAFADGTLFRRLDKPGRDRLRNLIPEIVQRAATMEGAATTLSRALTVLEACGRRSSYFAMLRENPQALRRMLDLCGRSDFLTRQIAASPMLIDELIDPNVQQSLPSRSQFEEDLERRLSAIPADDLEQNQDVLRRFQNAAVFRVALADIDGRLPLMKVSDRLTDIAELVIAEALRLTWHQLALKSESPVTAPGTDSPGFAVLGYGKLGGLELGYGSDLDLVLVYAPEHRAKVDGNAAVFYGRLGRRLISLLSMQTFAGRLYEVDLRLRPSGNAGLLVSSVGAFSEYQRKEAWTWEHQALLRARAVAGDPSLCVELEAIRREVLTGHVRIATLRTDVVEMREKMREELSRSGDDTFDIKQDPGGVGDIEFLVQYLVLSNASVHAELLDYPDNIRQIEGLSAAGILDSAQASLATESYLEYRKALHHLALEQEPGIVPRDFFADRPGKVLALWDTFLVES